MFNCILYITMKTTLLPYSANIFFGLENVVCLLGLLHLFKCTQDYLGDGSMIRFLLREQSDQDP